MQPGSPMFPSKTDHIMSRYRPIAPKPVPKAEGTDQTDSHSLSSLSTDKGSTKSAEHRVKRRNKRPPDSSRSPGQLKKPRVGTSSGSMSTKAEGNVEFQPTSFNLTPIFSDRVAPVFGPGGLQRFKDSFDHSQNGVSVSLSLSAKSPPPEPYYEHGPGGNPNSGLRCSKDGLSFNIGNSHEGLEKDRGFMERAARNTPSVFSVEYSNSILKREPFSGYPSASTSFGAESEVCSAEDATDSRKANIVTLSLLPDTPLANTRSSSSSSTLSLLRSDIRWSSDKQATISSDLNTSLTMSSKGRWSEEEASLGGHCVQPESFGPPGARPVLDRATGTSQADGGGRVVDAHYLEQRHGGSSEAVMLTDEMDTVLWVNSAFKRLSTERMISRIQAIGPHIDPLGIRTHLATLTFQPQFPATKCKAILWGFLKKFILPEAGTQNPSNLSEGQAQAQAQAQAKVLAPQPVRAVGSTITVQTIVTVDPHTAPLTEPFESVQERLDKADMPSVLTDLKFRVRWANAAYKRLVGQPKCSWLASAVGASADDDSPPSLRLSGDVSLVCDGSQLPADIAAFTCRVRIQWTHEGEHSAMSVPSEVVRLDDAAVGGLYVWGFDVCDAGVRNVLQIEDSSPFC
ncbi:hypothetical protein KC19_9G114100 [Ceratodon purpureus]|uniref:DUF7950 domain-containing protein n=1 Tax=Ceratodon purpureus TaxID=3225 RepID=A0A8T0GUH9_CERPU|nr:hypothetical protein KC19_9G114100 [Ceratodon purpureus]